jgi:hypothetical protein
MFVVPEEMEEEGGTVVNVADFAGDVKFFGAMRGGSATAASPSVE